MPMTTVWFAVQNLAAETFLERAGLIDTGEADVFYEAEISGAHYPGGWYVVLAADPDLFDADQIKLWSEGARLVAAIADEDALFSLATEWRDGRPLWSLSHEKEGEAEAMIGVEGELPEVFEAVRREFLEKQDGATPAELAFEAPLEVAYRITGFRADVVGFEEEGPVFNVLEPE